MLVCLLAQASATQTTPITSISTAVPVQSPTMPVKTQSQGMKQSRAVLKALLTLMGRVCTPLMKATSFPLGVVPAQALLRALHVMGLV
jgi:hypothetical protein